jgi:hypothetical protein
MFATKQYPRPFWQGIFLTTAFCLLSFNPAKAVTEQPADYSAAELEELVGPVALYPDDLIGIILPASTYPLQIVEAARYLEAYETNPALQPDEDWDDAVVALLNYPEIIELLNEDLDWTWNLGEAVVNQQADVLDAVQDFRSRAVVAGNLKSDDRQSVTYVDEVIEVSPVDPEVIYVPYYEPSQVVVYQRGPVYHYYPRPYPVYYYPYPAHYSFASGFFWGVTTAYTIGWLTDRVHFHYYGYASHPYYGHQYTNHYYSRHARRARHYNDARPRSHYVYDRRHYGNTWKPKKRHGDRPRHRSADRYNSGASNFTGTAQRDRPSGETRAQTGDGLRTSTRLASNQDNRQGARTRQTRSGDDRRPADSVGTGSRVADKSSETNRSRQSRTSNSRSGSNQIMDTRAEGRANRTSTLSTPRRRAGERANTNRRTPADTRAKNSTKINRTAQSRSGNNQIIDTSTAGRASRTSSASTSRRAGGRANTIQQSPRATRADNSVRVNRTATRVSSSTTTKKRATARAPPRQAQRQAYQAPSARNRSAPTARSASKSKSKSAGSSTTRVASASRTNAGQRESRSSRSGARRGHRR